MPRVRLVLLIFVLIGIALEAVSFYYAFHPRGIEARLVTYSEVGYLILAPIVAWRGRRERILAVAILCFWALWVVLLACGGYMLAYHDL
jgi:hypothetical protein